MEELVKEKITGHEKTLGELAVKKEELVKALQQLKEQFSKVQAGLQDLEKVMFSRQSAIAALQELQTDEVTEDE